jgi:hypothetical protein
MKSEARAWPFARKDNWKPRDLVLVGLAITVALWGFGYRLSTYQLHFTESARIAAAKLCAEPRNSLAAVSAHQAAPHLLASVPVPLSSHGFFTLSRSGIAPALPEQRAYRPANFDFLIPFRSPPPQRFLLA